MHKALKEREQQRAAFIELARSYVHKVGQLLPVSCGVVCGSVARGDFNLGSDIDVLIISDSLPPHPLDRMELLYRYVEAGLEPKGYTTDEFITMLGKGNPLAMDAKQNGVVVQDNGWWEKLVQVVKQKDLHAVRQA